MQMPQIRLKSFGVRALRRSCTPGFFLAAFLAAATPATAMTIVTFDWSNIVWPDGSLTNTYDFDPANPGDDIRITLSGDTGFFSSPSPNVYAAGNTFAFTGGISGTASAASQNLDLWVNYGANTQSVTVLVEFLYPDGVTGVQYSIFDVDSSTATSGGGTINYRDQLRNISAFDSGTTTTFYDPNVTIVNGAYVNSSGSGAGLTIQSLNSTAANATDNTSQGNVDFDWGSNVITSFTFAYGNATNVTANPAAQGIGIHDITFTVIPEPSTAILLPLAALILGARRRRR